MALQPHDDVLPYALIAITLFVILYTAFVLGGGA